MKRWEVTYQLMDSDFPRNHPVYYCLSGVPSKRVNACLGLYGGPAKRTRTIPAILCLYDSTCSGGLKKLSTHVIGV